MGEDKERNRMEIEHINTRRKELIAKEILSTRERKELELLDRCHVFYQANHCPRTHRDLILDNLSEIMREIELWRDR